MRFHLVKGRRLASYLWLSSEDGLSIYYPFSRFSFYSAGYTKPLQSKKGIMWKRKLSQLGIIQFLHGFNAQNCFYLLFFCFELRMCTLCWHRSKGRRYSANLFYKVVSSPTWSFELSSCYFCFVSNFLTGRSGNILFKFVIVTILVNLGS